MTNRTRRTLGAAFLSLLIALSFITSGGWFCADGSHCLPALSPVCCCGSEIPPTQVTMDECDRASFHTCRSEEKCGCYRDLPGTVTRLTVVQLLVSPPATLSRGAVTVPDPSPRLGSIIPSDEPGPPPRFLLSPRGTRAPPAA